MNDNQKRFRLRVIKAAEEALCKNNYVSPIDIFIGMGSLKPSDLEDWRKGRIPYLERAIQGNLSKISFWMKCFREWAKAKGLKPSYTAYIRKKVSGPARELRFSVSRDPGIEESYRTHYVSPLLCEIKERKIMHKLDCPPEGVVFRSVLALLCCECKKNFNKGTFFYCDEGRGLCLVCANLNKLEYLPREERNLTRHIVKSGVDFKRVVEFRYSDISYERIGILVDKESIRNAQKDDY